MALPRYFSRITIARLVLTPFFIAASVKIGELASSLFDAVTRQQLVELRIAPRKLDLLQIGSLLQCLLAALASFWAILNVFTERAEPSRRAGVRISYFVDLGVAAGFIIGIALQETATLDGSCGLNALKSSPHATAISRFCYGVDLAFGLACTMLVIHVASILIFTRYHVHSCVASSRADADDWAKNRSPRVGVIMYVLQVLAAPFRFLWRCLCKLSHASENPLQWAVLFSVLLVPLALILVLRIILACIDDLRERLRDFRARGMERVSSEAAVKPTSSARLPDLETGIGHHESPVGSNDSKAGAELIPSKPCPSMTIGQVKLEREEKPWWKLRSFTRPTHSSGNTVLERLLTHEDLFFPFMSQLHGLQIRQLKRVSRSCRDVITDNERAFPNAFASVSCSRSDPLPIHHWPQSRRSCQVAQNSGRATDYWLEDPLRKPCWSCGVTVCRKCRTEKSARISKTEVRLHSLVPVCSTCYFKCLCQPRGYFASMSARCSCTAAMPLDVWRSLCRECSTTLVEAGMWRRRLARGALMAAEDLEGDWTQWLDSGALEDPRRGPRVATHVRNCQCCGGKLWWLFGKSWDLRWWRCTKCGLKVRDVLMSTRRELDF